MGPIRVLIVDDHPMVRRGLHSLLSSFPDISVVGEAEDGASALRAAREQSPDVILLDVQMAGPDGIAVATLLCKEVPQAKIIILTAYDNEEYVLGALRAGAVGYLLKSSSGEAVADAVRQVHQGKRLISPALIDRALQQLQDLVKAQAKNRFGLTTEELRVLALIAQGATNEEIAKELYWGERTVRRKVEEIMTKIGAKSRAQAVALALREGLI